MARRKPARTLVVAPQQTTPTIIEFLLDETGSMGSCKSATVAGFNEFLTEQRRQDGDCLLTLTKFDTAGQKTPYVDIDVSMVPFMTDQTFLPGGGTNLRDTIGARIASLKNRLANWPQKPNVLFIVMTDGDDNASREFSEPAIKLAIEACMENGWTFVYLGADQDAIRVASRLGFPAGNIKSFARARMRETMTTLAAGTTAYRATRTSTASTERDFFSATR
jgi:hypothetical protein